MTKIEAQKRVREWLVSSPSHSQAQLAKAVAINAATLSTFMSGKCEKRTETRAIEVLAAFFHIEDRRVDLLPEPDFIRTRQAKRIENFISMIHVSKSIGVLHGSSGIGKTLTIENYKRDNPSVYYIPINPLIRTKSQFFLTIAWIVLGKQKVPNAGMVFDEVAVKAATQGALFVIDDAHLLYTDRSVDDSAFEIIRTLNDRGIAFIVSGNGSLRDKVTQTSKAEFYQQFASRAKVQEISHNFVESDVRDIVDSVLQNKKYSEDVFEFLYKMTNRFYGSLRVMVNTLQLAAFNANARNEALTRAHLKSASTHIISTIKPEAKIKGRVHAKKTENQDRESLDTEKELASAVA